MDLSEPIGRAPRAASYYDLPRMIRVAGGFEGYRFIAPERVCMMRCNEKLLTIFLDDGTSYTGDQGMGALIDSFPGVWMRTSRTFAVRQASITEVVDDYVVLDNGDRAPLSRRQREALIRSCVPITRLTRSLP